MHDIIIVGAGPVGLYASFYAGMRGLKGLLIESQNYVGGQLASIYPSKPIYDIPGFIKITAGDFIENLKAQYQQFNQDIILKTNTKLTEIKKVDDHFLVICDKEQFETKTILLTTGNGDYRPRPLDIKDATNYSNIIYNFKDVTMFNDKKVAILGGGDSAVDFANMIKEVASKTYLIHRRNEFRAHEDSLNKYKEKGVIYTPYKAISFGKTNGNLVTSLNIQNVETNEIKEIDVDYILVNYGNLPSSSDLTALGFNGGKEGLEVDINLMTNIDGVYACGNAITYPSKIKTITTGLAEAMTAINNINFRLFPNKNTKLIYSSMLMKK